jgi:Zn-dependent peptidase ImmA (M78 family)/transcriptional regulator with XRE-family HTH domain
MIRWARDRAGLTTADLSRRFPKLGEWEADDSHPTMRQLEDFARATHTPVGYFFLPQPPVETLPIPDFRTFGDSPVRTPTPELLDTIYSCEQRQEWFRAYASDHGVDPVPFVGTASLDDQPHEVAARLRDILGFGLARRVDFGTWTNAIDGLRDHAEDVGVLVMISGVVGTNSHRKLNPDEFRGFSLVDALAPLIFINGADSKAAQIFSLAHELAHLALGGSGVSRPDLGSLGEEERTERWCNAVAAELLVPADSLRAEMDRDASISSELQRLARFYKVSTLVILRRMLDVSLITRAVFREEYDAELSRIMAIVSERESGGNFYNTHPVRVSKRFARALITDTLEGRTLYGEAFRLLGFKKTSAFHELGERLGVA